MPRNFLNTNYLFGLLVQPLFLWQLTSSAAGCCYQNCTFATCPLSSSFQPRDANHPEVKLECCLKTSTALPSSTIYCLSHCSLVLFSKMVVNEWHWETAEKRKTIKHQWKILQEKNWLKIKMRILLEQMLTMMVVKAWRCARGVGGSGGGSYGSVSRLLHPDMGTPRVQLWMQ